MTDLIVTQHPGWVQLTLNRPQARNALTTALLAALADALAQAAQAADCRAVLICGAGGNFAAGADIGEIAARTSAQGDPRPALWAGIRAFPKPLVAAVDGYALGGGFELALMADLLILGGTARVGLPETTLGLIPGAGGGQRLLALVGRMRASRLVLEGEILDAATADAWGIGSTHVPGSAEAEGVAVCRRLALRAPLALMAAKAALVAGAEAGLAFGQERAGFAALLGTADKAEGIAAHRDRRPPLFSGT